ncbi:MAG: hypothetical protein KKB50_14700, partial [Planctomycetes bacterium]|nr:hypothetical protein [Planctomycetota bacterium]
MRKICCIALVVAFAATIALAERPQLQSLDKATRVQPKAAALISPDGQMLTAWQPVGGVAQDCWAELVFDCYEPITDASFGTLGFPTDGANWGGYDPVCFPPGGGSSRWYYGPSYCNPQ